MDLALGKPLAFTVFIIIFYYNYYLYIYSIYIYILYIYLIIQFHLVELSKV